MSMFFIRPCHPQLLYVLECGEYDDIITWAPNGLSFVITDTKQFEDMVLPEVFKEAKFASFQRKVRSADVPFCSIV